jgi:predicted DNA-binding antitoxin AbrB/MazE fold protein
MTIVVEATFENGILMPKQPVALSEGTEVRLTIHTVDEDYDPLDAVIGICQGEGATDGAANHDKYLYGKPQA